MSFRLKVLAVAFALSSSLSATAAPRTYIAPASERDSARAIADAYRGLSSKIPLELYDVDGLAESLDYDVAAAANFVRDNIAYDPYLGVMRGPEGTISASAGSSWDQAVLLAALINVMAGEAMIVKGTLDKKDSERLLLGSFSKRAPLSPGLSDDDVSAMFAEFVPKARLSSVKAEARELKANAKQNAALAEMDVANLAKRISASLKGSDISIPESDKLQTDELISQLAEEYVWVRYRDTPNDPWIDVHPAFQGATAPKVQPKAFISGTVPKERLHEIEIRLEIERKTGDKLERISIMSPYRRPAANLALNQISISIAPDTIRDDGEAKFFIPFINQQPAERAQAFSFLGLTASAEDVATGPEIFATVASKYAGALGALNAAEGKEDSAPRLSGVILTVVHISPGGAATSFERRLTDFRQGIPESPSRLVSFQGVFDVNVGSENGARAMKDWLEFAASFARVAPYYRAIGERKITTEEAASHPAFAPDQSNPTWLQMLFAGNAFDPPANKTQNLVRSGPMVSMRRIQFIANKKGLLRQTVDILADNTLSLSNQNGQVSANPVDNFEHGIRTTLVEHVLGSGTSANDWRLRDITAVLSDAASVKAWSDQSGASTTIRERLTADLESGSVIVLLGQQSSPLWWKLNPKTGQILGMGPQGGEVATEYLTFQKIASATLAGFSLGYGTASCLDVYSNNPSMAKCCVAGNAAMSVGFGLYSGAIGADLAGVAGDVAVSSPMLAGLGYIASSLFVDSTYTVMSGMYGGSFVDSVCQEMLAD
ncbi:MAG: hypothetical protein V7741_09920 [Hyphomonas sp.]